MGWHYINTTIYIVNTVCVQCYSRNVDPPVSCPSAKVSWDMNKKKIHCSVLLKKKKHSLSKPSAVQQAFPEALREGLNPVMSQHHSLRHTQVELLLWVQNHSVGLGYSEQLLQQLYEFVLRMVWGDGEVQKHSNFLLVLILKSGDRGWANGCSYMADKRRWPSCLSRVWRSEYGHREDWCLLSGSPLPLETWITGNQAEEACW